MEDTQLLDQFAGITVWKQGERRAPHKPLLLLLALARLQRGDGPRLVPFEDIAAPLADLIQLYGPSSNVQPELPFWHLRSDGIWEIPEAEAFLQSHASAKRKRMSATDLRRAHAHGGLTQQVWETLQARPDLVNRIVAGILHQHFPDSLHEDLLDKVGMPWIVEPYQRRRRDPDFRRRVLNAYSHRCAICGFDGRLNQVTAAVEAAHIKWHAAGGPDSVENAVALCSIHHKVFDLGALGISEEGTILVSQEIHGGPMVGELVLRFASTELAQPSPPHGRPDGEFVRWHRDEVFRGEPR